VDTRHHREVSSVCLTIEQRTIRRAAITDAPRGGALIPVTLKSGLVVELQPEDMSAIDEQKARTSEERGSAKQARRAMFVAKYNQPDISPEALVEVILRLGGWKIQERGAGLKQDTTILVHEETDERVSVYGVSSFLNSKPKRNVEQKKKNKRSHSHEHEELEGETTLIALKNPMRRVGDRRKRYKAREKRLANKKNKNRRRGE